MSLFQQIVEGLPPIAPIVPFKPAIDSVVQMDFGANDTLFLGYDLANPFVMENCISAYLKEQKASYGVGGYAVLRAIYGRSTLFDGEEEEPRRFHIGCDVFGDAGTSIFAPIEGVVHSFADNHHQLGDYGPTIILQHKSAVGVPYYTLYGHLSRIDLHDLSIGKHIAQGEAFAHFGRVEENGNWSPHLHFQIILDIGDYWGDYPGVCRYSERDYYLQNCPNPQPWLPWQ